MAKLIDIRKIKKNPDNPRVIKNSDFRELQESIKGQKAMMKMRGILVDENMMVIGGNQRLAACIDLGWKKIPYEIFTRKDAEEVNEERAKHGLEHKSYEDQVKEITIKDNTHAGEWDVTKLVKWGVKKEDLKKWKVPINLQQKMDQAEEGDEIELEQSVQIEPPKEFIVIMADPNSEEWEEVKERLKLKKVRKGGYKKGSPFDAVGLERVLTWEELKKRLKC